MLCERKNLDRSQPEKDMHLLSLFKRKAEEGRLNDIVDKYNDEIQLHGAEVVEMMRVAVWCLQSDFSKRPSMSMVVKVLEGSVDVEKNLDYNFTNPNDTKINCCYRSTRACHWCCQCHYSIVSISSVWTAVKK
ncbi:G-type lectin S-receptor-like serine/threonine-protein kinase SD2-5 [Camellia lanceoleosa]|uniref:G-type lectin S-receptor-like serine/threonine-protein kinase SD2-5 n=1 Tax=Camellia lanceoleosa TaxID=1840588 RepID=A0ACC0H677_9ERIC|nr:G-type lectin S-receptor-like serine/threonine-protein kinase SD2-5 [Camellia lanceoleosa]